jgi:uncharacterized iron-regulated membrane protein
MITFFGRLFACANCFLSGNALAHGNYGGMKGAIVIAAMCLLITEA